MRRGDRAAVSALALAWTGLFLYIDPRGGFPLNDDFQYAEAVRRWANGAGLTLSQWGFATSVAHLALGRLAAVFVTPDNWHLRLLMLGAGLATTILFYLFLRDLGLDVSRSLAGAAVLALNPVFLTMSASFHVDVTATALQIAAAWAFVAALRDDSLPLMILSSSLLGIGYLTRQTAVFSAAGGIFLLWRGRRLTPRFAAALLVPVGLAACGFWLWMHGLRAKPWAWQTQLSESGFLALIHPAEWLRATQNLNASAQTAALFLCPLAFGLAHGRTWTKPGRFAVGAASFVSLLAVFGWFLGARMPLLGNTLTNLGLGVVTLTAPESKAALLWNSPRLWRLVDMLCLLCAAQLALLLCRKKEKVFGQDAAATVLWFGLPPYLLILGLIDVLNRSMNFDRYLLAPLPFLIAFLLLRSPRLRLLPCAAGCLLLATVSAAGLRDYFAWNRARWEAGLYGVRLGLKPDQIENGFDWDGQFSLERNMAKLLAEKPAREIGIWDWMKENRVLMITSFSQVPPKEDFKLIGRFPYRTPLSRGPAYVYLYGAQRAFRPRR
ncbi:MAG: glycosyltransferase family 39 protein [Elusimicrobia bacterium]|nr:glycosyltransferase family 39 protein [Elusimicrobiota bacterium]